MEKGISLIIPTYNGGQIFSRCLEMVGQQDYGGEIQLIILDSGSTDGTVELAERAGAFVRIIDGRQFHHSKTRNSAIRLAKFDKIVFTVQDAVPCSRKWLSDLERSLCETRVAAVYTDQIPHDDANPYARFEIESISKARGQVQKIQQIESPEAFYAMPYDVAYRTISLDNVCAIYRKELLMITPFPEVDFAEDMAWALKNMLLGHKVLYNPNIKVKHSHNRPPEYAFNRQVINSLWCAKIMNRVEDDLSFVTIRDLMALTRAVERFVHQLGSDILGEGQDFGNKGKKRPEVIGRIWKGYSLRNRARYFLLDKLLESLRLQSLGVGAIAQRAEDSIRHVLNLIEKGYKVTGGKDLIEALDQIAVNILGRIYGETYASGMLRGRISARLEAFFKPYMHGV